MSGARSEYLLNSSEARRIVMRRIAEAPWNSRVEVKAPKRSIPQNSRLWLLLTAVAAQAEWAGKQRTELEWKDLFTGAVKIAGGGIEAVPGLEGGLMLLGLHTSDMTKAEMVELQDYIEAWCASNGVVIPEQSPSDLPIHEEEAA